MPSWTHLVRFFAVEDNNIHLGQLVDVERDVGLDSFSGQEIKAYLINGSIFDGEVTEYIMTAKHILSPISTEDCNFIRCLGLNYKDHAKESNMALPKAPVLFAKPRTALADPFPAALNIPRCAQDNTSDYEAEPCVVIGRTGRNIPEEKVFDYVLGYTACNDVSARTLQIATPQWGYSKGLDGSCPLGPVLVSPKAIPDPQALDIKAIYNGKTVQDGHARDMIFDIKTTIAYLSQGTTLERGTILITGTPAGIGCLQKPPVVLEDGGDIRIYISSIGTLINNIRYEDR